MGRGRYPARLQVLPPSAEIAAQYLMIWPGREVYAAPELFPLLCSAALFGNDRPFEVDIGCATGELVCALAAAQPEHNYLGVDIALKPLYRAVEIAAQRGLSNVKFLQSDMLLAYGRIADASLDAAYVHFPAPLLRTRQRKQRLVAPALLEHMQRTLAPMGSLSFMTDQPDLYTEFLRLLAGYPGLRLRAVEEQAAIRRDLLASHYQRRWEARGRPIVRAEVERIPSSG
ncbi:tRNA (guanine(46)-N(7))-methyltransferase TrmB [Candidatus Oscillochloris fontis]|uniref:tRNA (guanine(46)-N(7))-methyltransferase TrmB n=1 Tax=Candidatus Oscillochloris fontis TaxID=2496868 RepID=UPI00101DC4A8|nr:methyltransferase domain-containing protein [Candidatus Oscillochloris fontis]